ncbi:MAG: RHS repeat domain-containing protein [Parahaliea sp.]
MSRKIFTRITDIRGGWCYRYNRPRPTRHPRSGLTRQLGHTTTHTYATAGGGQFSFETGHRYNADDQLHSHTWPDGSQQTYHYSKGLLSQITLPDQSRISYSQYQWLRPGQISTPGTTRALTYDGLQRPLTIEVSNSSSQSLSQRQYQYSSAGNITQLGSELGQTDYGYDRLNRLTQATPDAALHALGLPVERYTYDAVGNRTSSAHQSGVWRYNADNQLTQYPQTVPFSPAPFNQSPAIDTQINYSPQGHTLKESNSHTTRDYGYNAADRLTRYRRTAAGQSTPDLQANYQYDPFGRRIAKHVTEGGTTNTKSTYFIYSEQGLLGETDQDGTLTKAYGFNPVAADQGLWSTDPIWQASIHNGSLTDARTEMHYLHTDHLGTPILATTKAGQTSWQAQAEAFGAAGILPGNRIRMNLRLPGQYFDGETGLHYNYFRDYDPSLGRYIQSDPLGLEGGLNTYAYVGGNPLAYIDPTGEAAAVAIPVALLLLITSWVAVNTVIDPSKPIPPQLPGYQDPTTFHTSTQQCSNVPSSGPPNRRDRCMAAAALKFTACMKGSVGLVGCYVAYSVRILVCQARSPDGDDE